MSFITSLISISSLATWIFLPLNAIFLTLDGIVYSLVAYSYKIFMLIAQLNYNVLYAWISPLLDRIKAIILVFIMFKVGYALIQYMINPDSLDDTAKGGPALIKNIAIASGMLIIYTFVFSFMNELTLLMIGVPDGYEFTTLKQVADVTNNEKDSGLIARFIFGSDADNVGEFGKKLAVNTLNIFLHSKDGKTSDLDDIYNELANGDMNAFDAMKIVTIVARIDKDVEYKWPLVSTITGLYLTWQIIKLAVELAIRMFKLMVLQVLAPLAIVSIIDGGTKNATWSGYVKTFFGTWMDAFIRVGSLYLATALIGKFWVEKSELMPEATGITKGLIFLIIMFSAYKCVELIPKLIKQVFPSMGASGDNAAGFGKLFTAGAGALIGAAGSGYLAAKAGNSAGGVLSSILTGGFNGGAAGSRSANAVQFFRNQGNNLRGSAERAVQNNAQGGVRNRLRNNFLNAAGVATVVNAAADENIKKETKDYEEKVAKENEMYEQAERNMDNMDAKLSEDLSSARTTMSQSDSEFTYSDGSFIQYGPNADTFSEAVANNDYKYRQMSEVTERYERKLQQNNYTDDVDQYGNVTKTAAKKREADEKTLRVARESAEIFHREAKQAAQESWKRKEESSGISRIEAEQKELTSQRRQVRNEHSDNMRNIESEHKAATKNFNDSRIPK